MFGLPELRHHLSDRVQDCLRVYLLNFHQSSNNMTAGLRNCQDCDGIRVRKLPKQNSLVLLATVAKSAFNEVARILVLSISKRIGEQCCHHLLVVLRNAMLKYLLHKYTATRTSRRSQHKVQCAT